MNAPTRYAAPRRHLGRAVPALALLLYLAACHAAAPAPTTPKPATAPAATTTTAPATAPTTAPAPVSPAAPAQDAASTTLRRAIAAEVGGAACGSASECRSSALGAKACGGPDAYLAWSTVNSDPARLRQLLARYAAARSREDQAAGLMSTCSVTSDPGATCQAGHCVLLPRGAGGPAVY